MLHRIINVNLPRIEVNAHVIFCLLLLGRHDAAEQLYRGHLLWNGPGENDVDDSGET
jgi:hypothetical protein